MRIQLIILFIFLFCNCCSQVELINEDIGNPPNVYAGANQSVCDVSYVILRGIATKNPTGTLWTTRGDGTFADSSLLTTTYTFGTTFIDTIDLAAYYTLGTILDTVCSQVIITRCDDTPPEEPEGDIGGYYVSPADSGGSDLADGSYETPWATWQHAIEQLEAGDTLYARGGVYNLGTNDYVYWDPETEHGNNGTYAAPILFYNYPDEIPILDAIGHTNTSDASAFDMENVDYVYLRGLTVRNQRQHTGVSDQWIASMQFYHCGTIKLDRITCHSGGGYGIWFSGYDTLIMTNCDSYDHVDTIREDMELGNRSDGFQISSGSDVGDYTYISGCRSFNNSDDGMEISTGRECYVDNCWVFNNGRYSHGAGTGFKFGPAYDQTFDHRIISHCLAAFNKGNGFSDQNLLSEDYGPIMHFYNNTSYRNRFAYDSDEGEFICATGYTEELFRNNIAYEATYGGIPSYYTVYLTLCATQDNHAVQWTNTWSYDSESPFWVTNDSITVTDEDFVLVDSTTGVGQMLAPRKVDGSLPDITFLRLTTGSDLIDAGFDWGQPYEGTKPDIGYDEYGD